MRWRLIQGVVGLLLVAMCFGAADANAARGKLIAYSTGFGPWPNPYVSEIIDRPGRFTYRIKMKPEAPAKGEVEISCFQSGKPDDDRVLKWRSRESFQSKVPMVLPRPAYCMVSVDFQYRAYPRRGTAKVALYMTKRKSK